MIELAIKESFIKRRKFFNTKYSLSVKFNFVSPKKALIILSIIAAIILSAFLAYYFFSGINNSKSGSKLPGTGAVTPPAAVPSEKDLNKIIEKKNSNLPLTEEESTALNRAISEKAQEKVGEIQKAAEERSYNQNEVDIIANPDKAAKEDLGVIETPVPETGANPLTQEEIDAIANPKK
ncbi:MAG: hypothetical protein WC745_04745 [Patescibacteria group bacterium]|jgi:hypothetical protein